jgi:DHA2 family methylenomycin A resistance protein-like MFS transporter
MIAAGAGIAAAGCIALLGIERGSGYGQLCAQLVAMGAGLGLLVPPLTSMLLGSVEKSRSGVAAGVLNATRQTGSVIGVALFGSLLEHKGAFMTGVHLSLVISTVLFVGAAAMALLGARKEK